MKRMHDKMGPVAESDRSDVLSSSQSHAIAVPQRNVCSPPLKNSPESLFTETSPRSAGCTGNNSTYPTFTYQPSMSASVAGTLVKMAYPQPMYTPYVNPMYSSLNLMGSSPPVYDQGPNLSSLFYSSPPSSASRLTDPQIATYLSDYYGNLTRQYSCSAPQLNPSSMYCTPPYSPPYRRDITPNDFANAFSASCDYASQLCKSFDTGLGNPLPMYHVKSSPSTDNSKPVAYPNRRPIYQPIYQPVSPCSPDTCDAGSGHESCCDYKNGNSSMTACVASNNNVIEKSIAFEACGDMHSASCNCCIHIGKEDHRDESVSEVSIDKKKISPSCIKFDSCRQYDIAAKIIPTASDHA